MNQTAEAVYPVQQFTPLQRSLLPLLVVLTLLLLLGIFSQTLANRSFRFDHTPSHSIKNSSSTDNTLFSETSFDSDWQRLTDSFYVTDLGSLKPSESAVVTLDFVVVEEAWQQSGISFMASGISTP